MNYFVEIKGHRDGLQYLTTTLHEAPSPLAGRTTASFQPFKHLASDYEDQRQAFDAITAARESGARGVTYIIKTGEGKTVQTVEVRF
ncbi:MAG: hypothetical protein AAF512_25580 [Pseudomonadota bacterium]